MALFLLEKNTLHLSSVLQAEQSEQTHKEVILSCCFNYAIYFMCGVTKRVGLYAGNHE